MAKKRPTVLTTARRTQAGSRPARRERDAGRVPVNVYGHGEANENLSIEGHALSLALLSHAHVFTLSIEGREQPCLVKEVQYDTFGQDLLHVDFARVSLTEEVEVEVELEFVGLAKGIASGGALAVHHPKLWIRCVASAIPDSIRVDVTEIEMGHAMHASEIALPAGVTLDTQRMQPADQIVGVVAPRVEAPEPTEAAELVEGAIPAEGAAAEAKPGEPAPAAAKGEKAAAPGKPEKAEKPEKGGKGKGKD